MATFPEDADRLEAAAQEASLSRLYGGIHHRFDMMAGLALGRKVAAKAMAADLDKVAVPDVRAFEVELYKFIETRHPQVFRGIVEKKQLDDQLKGALDAAVKEFANDFASRKASAA